MIVLNVKLSPMVGPVAKNMFFSVMFKYKIVILMSYCHLETVNRIKGRIKKT